MPFRHDTGILGDKQRTPQGGFIIPAYPTRVGVLPYLLGNGSVRREYRPPEEVFDPESLASLRHAPVTDLHPEENGIRIPVTPENYKRLSVGHTGEDVRPEGDLVAASVLVQDSGMISKIDAGERREISCGYSCDLDPTPGVTDRGEVYDAIQRRIRYNHVALGPENWGRAGSSVCLRLDSDDGIQQPGKEKPLKTEIIDGKEYTIGSAEWIEAKNRQYQSSLGRADAAEKAQAAEKVRADSAEKALAAAKDPKSFQSQVTQRVRLVLDCTRAARSKGARFDAEAAAGATNDELIVQAIKMLDPGFDANGKSPEYLAGYFASLMKSVAPAQAAETEDAQGEEKKPEGDPAAPPAKPEDKTDSKVKSIFDVRKGDKEIVQEKPAHDPDKARTDMHDKQSARWKGDLAATKKR